MALRGAAARVLLLVAACSGGTDDPAEEVVFRVGATAGLANLTLRDLSGSSAAAVDLVLDPAIRHVEVVRAEGSTLTLRRRPNSPLTAKQLAESLRSSGLVSARVVDSDRFEALFKDEVAAKLAMDPWLLAFDVGPFRVESQEPGRARLRSRGHSAIDVVEIIEISSADEWRKFMAREIDVMPSSPNLYREQFDGMGSVRLLDIPATASIALYFNVRHPALANPGVRRQIAAALRRPAIARVATGDPSSAVEVVQPEPDEQIRLPPRLSLLLVEDDSTLLLAASVLRHQLDHIGIALDIEPASLENTRSRIEVGRHELLLAPLTKDTARYVRFVSPGPGILSMTGFSNPDYDSAVQHGDLGRAQVILDREIPATELYELRTFAAVDGRFCGKVTPSDNSWRWMADLRPCEDGEGKEQGEDTP